jgi:hypothetical protein
LYILPIIASVYNNTVHSTIKMKPIEVTKAKEKQILTSIYNQTKLTTPSRKFIVGNFLRISKAKYIFNKGNTPNWTTELLKVAKIQPTNPTTYVFVRRYARESYKWCFLWKGTAGNQIS